jgi:hypothetical protein
MSGTDARVGQRLAQGMDITEATKESEDAGRMAESNMMVDRDEDYNTRYAGYKGYLLAFERTKLIPRRTAPLDLVGLTRAAGADSAEQIVDHFVVRFVSAPVSPKDRSLLVEFLAKKGSAPFSEETLRELLYLVWCMPAYQLG